MSRNQTQLHVNNRTADDVKLSQNPRNKEPKNILESDNESELKVDANPDQAKSAKKSEANNSKLLELSDKDEVDSVSSRQVTKADEIVEEEKEKPEQTQIKKDKYVSLFDLGGINEPLPLLPRGTYKDEPEH